MAITALAGPVANILLAWVLLAVYKLLGPLLYQLPALPFLFAIIIRNTVYLAVFNLIPIPPLDGSKVLFSLLPERAYYTLMRYERFGMLALLLLVWLDVGGGLLSQGIEAVFLWMAGLFFGH